MTVSSLYRKRQKNEINKQINKLFNFIGDKVEIDYFFF